MRIEIGGEGRPFHITVPRFLAANRLVLRLILKQYCGDLGLSPQAVTRLRREFSRTMKQHPGWVLVEVQSADGETVRIIL